MYLQSFENIKVFLAKSPGKSHSPFAASPLIEKNPIPTSPQMGISSVTALLQNFIFRLGYRAFISIKGPSVKDISPKGEGEGTKNAQKGDIH